MKIGLLAIRKKIPIFAKENITLKKSKNMTQENLKWFQKPFVTEEKTLRWWAVGLFSGALFYIVMMAVLGVNGSLSGRVALIGIPICAIGGLIFVWMLKRNANMQLSNRRRR